MKNKATVCVIDDDEIFQFITKKSFERLNRNDDLLFFQNGEDALIYMKGALTGDNPKPDVIFLDINMPIMDGWDFLNELQKLNQANAELPNIYMVSSSIDDKDLIKSKSFPIITDYIVKPIKDVNIKEILNGLN